MVLVRKFYYNQLLERFFDGLRNENLIKVKRYSGRIIYGHDTYIIIKVDYKLALIVSNETCSALN